MIDLPPPDPGIEIVVASHGMSKGVAQTEGPQLVVKPSAKLGDFQLGGQWKNVTSTVAGGEGALFAGWSHEIAKFQLSLQASYKFQTGVKEPTDDKSWEFTGALSRKLGRVTLRGSIIYSPDDLGSAERSVFIEGGPTWELDKSTRVSAAIGHRDRKLGDDYTAFNAGVATTLFKGVVLDARLYGTNREELGINYKERIVISARMAL